MPKRPPYGELTKQVLALASRERGMTTKDIDGASIPQVGRACRKLCAEGVLFCARLSYKSARYFTDKTRAEELEKRSKDCRDRGWVDDTKTTAKAQRTPAWKNGPAANPAGVEAQRFTAPPQRVQVVELLSDHKPVVRSGAFDFRKYQKPGRY